MSQLDRLPEQMARREHAATYLDTALAAIEGIKPMVRRPEVTAHAHHIYMFRYDAQAFGGLSRAEFVRALVAEGIPCSAGYSLISDEMAIQTETVRLCAALGRDLPAQTASLTEARRACVEGVWLPQRVLLAGETELQDIVEAVRKVQRLSPTLVHA